MMMDINSLIDEMTNDILNQKRALDMLIFLNFLKAELKNAGIALTIRRYQTPAVTGSHIVTSDIAGIQLDPSEHDKEKDTEIEKYKKLFKIAEQERDRTACKYQNEIDRLKSRIGELEESQEILPTEPIKMADWIVHHFKQGKEYAIYDRDMDGKLQYIEIDGEKVPIQTGEYGRYEEVREIADYLLAYCKYHSEED